MRWLLWCFCLLAESYETINHYHYHYQQIGTYKRNTTGKHEAPINDAQGCAYVVKIYYKTYENHPRRKTQQPRYVMVRYQASQIRKCAATQRYSDNQRAQVICCQLQYYRPYWKGSLMRHHEMYSKRTSESQFRSHHKRKCDSIFY